MTRTRLGLVLLLLYVASAVLANVLTAHYGRIPVGFGLAATAGTYAAGGALFARNLIQDTLGVRATLAAIVAGTVAAALSAWLATPSLAVASALTFAVAELVELAVYSPLRRRRQDSPRWALALIVASTAGALVDTFLFLRLAHFPTTAAGVTGQLLGKVLYVAIPAAILVALVRRALLREPVDA